MADRYMVEEAQELLEALEAEAEKIYATRDRIICAKENPDPPIAQQNVETALLQHHDKFMGKVEALRDIEILLKHAVEEDEREMYAAEDASNEATDTLERVQNEEEEHDAECECDYDCEYSEAVDLAREAEEEAEDAFSLAEDVYEESRNLYGDVCEAVARCGEENDEDSWVSEILGIKEEYGII